MLSESLPAAAQGTHLWLQSQMEEFEKGTPDGVAIESDGHLRQAPGLTELLTTPSTFVWSISHCDKTAVFLQAPARRPRCCVSAAEGRESRSRSLKRRDLSVQALCIGPDGALYAATVPSGKVYKLNPNATTKHDETAPRLFSTLARPLRSAAGVSKPAATALRLVCALHLGSDLRFVRTPLYRDRKSRSRLPRRSRQARRGAGVVLQER